MKTCHVCGAQVDDRELTCPECGATVVKHSGGFSIKAEEPVKKKTSNPMGMTISTGSGLTDILRSENEDVIDDDFYGNNMGSMPVSMSRTVIDDEVKKISDGKKVFGTVFKILLVALIAYGAYYLVTNVFLKKDKVESYEAALEVYVDSINNDTVDELKKIVPPYIADSTAKAESVIKETENDEITKYDIVSVEQYSGEQIVSLQDDIKLSTSKTANIKSACSAKVRFYGTTINSAGVKTESNHEVDMIFVQIRDNWYIHFK